MYPQREKGCTLHKDATYPITKTQFFGAFLSATRRPRSHSPFQADRKRTANTTEKKHLCHKSGFEQSEVSAVCQTLLAENTTHEGLKSRVGKLIVDHEPSQC
jgi:hypothetical protein